MLKIQSALKKMKIVVLFAIVILSVAVATGSFKGTDSNKQQKEKKSHSVGTAYYHPENQKNKEQKEIYLFATGYYHPEEDQDFYVTGTYEEDLELNGQGRTASGKEIRKGHAAVDPYVIPLGTEFHTEEYGILKAEDTGGRIKGNRIDIFTGNGQHGLTRALKIRGWLKLKILKWGDKTRT